VCITSHGSDAYDIMAKVAAQTGGKAYPEGGKNNPINPQQLPAIYTKEARLVSKSFVYHKQFLPQLVEETGPAAGLPKNLEHLYGFVLTTKRPSPLVKVPIWAPQIAKEDYPVLAHWQYGLGKSVAFTSDALTKPGDLHWDKDWAASGMYAKFWKQVIEWTLRSVEGGSNMTMTTEQKNGKIKVIIKAQDENKAPLTDVELQAGVIAPSLKSSEGKPKLKFEQTKPGIYEAEIQAEDVGSYFFNIQGKWKDAKGELQTDSVRAGATISYSPEFAEMTSNLALLKKLTEITGGKMYADEASYLDEVARSGEVFRPVPILNLSLLPIWPWLVFLAAVCLLFDIALRRLAFDPTNIVAGARNLWARLRGHRLEPAGPQFLDRLQTRKSQIGQELDRARATRRFDGDKAPAAPPAGAGDVPEIPSRPGERRPTPAAPGLAPGPQQKKEAEPQDYASRLMKAKKKVWRDKDKGK
jgi:hypothetical protein